MHGILNGTGNFILDRMDRFGMDFDEALKEAQRSAMPKLIRRLTSAALMSPTKPLFPLLWRAAPRLRTIFRCSASRSDEVFLDDLKREGKTLRHMMLFKRTNNRAAWALRLLCFRSNHLKHRCAATSTA